MDILPRFHEAWPLIHQALEASEHAAKLTRQMLAYAGKGKFFVERINLSGVIREALPLIERSVPRTVQLSTNLEDNLPPIEADASQVEQVVMNLVINAAEAYDGRPGVVSVTTAKQQVDETYIQRISALTEIGPGEFVCLEVRDNGSGMDAATQGKIFDPFFTTKFTGRGLGLAAVLGIVRGHKGALRVYSEPGRGSTFRVLFPKAAGTIVSAAAPPEKPVQNLRGRGTILIVDDEEIVRRTAKLALELFGYTVLTAENGQAGVSAMRAADRQVSLVLLDMTMPVMSGEETLAEIRKTHPGVPVIISTGFSEAQAILHFRGQKVSGFLQKPFTARQLGGAVKSILQEDRT